MNKFPFYLLTASFLMISKGFSDENNRGESGSSALEQLNALRQEEIQTEVDRKAASDAAKAKIEELRKEQRPLLAQALREMEEKIKEKKIERSEFDKQNQKEIDELMKLEAEAKKATTPTSAATQTASIHK